MADPIDVPNIQRIETSLQETAKAVISVAEEANAAFNAGIAGSVDIEDESTPVAAAATINFTGAGVTATPGAPGTVNVAIPGGGGGGSVNSVTLNPPLVQSGTATDPIGDLPNATPSASGAMSGPDKTKLNTITAGAAVASVTLNAPFVQSGTATNPVGDLPNASGANDGAMSIADFNKLAGLPTNAVPDTRTITAGDGMTGGGDLSADRTLNVVANADGSIVANPNDIQVGVLATDAQHGTRGGGTQHATAIANIAAGFISASDQDKLNGLPASAVPTSRTLTAGDGLVGGGDLSADRTFTVNPADGTITVSVAGVALGVIPFAKVAAALALANADIDVNSEKITSLANGTNPGDAVNYSQLSALLIGLKPKENVRLFANVQTTLFGPQTVDGQLTAEGDRIGVGGQTTPSENGIYIAHDGLTPWTRADDLPVGSSATNIYFFVTAGTTYTRNGIWCLTNPAVVGTNGLTMSVFKGADDYIEGDGIDITGNVLSVEVNVDGTLLVDGSGVRVGTVPALQVSYTPTTASDWPIVPSDAQEAFDTLADVLATTANEFVYRQGGTAGGHVYVTFAGAYAAAIATDVPATIYIDDSLGTPTTGTGAFDLTRIKLAAMPEDTQQVDLLVPDGASITGMTILGRNLRLTSFNNTAPTMAVSVPTYIWMEDGSAFHADDIPGGQPFFITTASLNLYMGRDTTLTKNGTYLVQHSGGGSLNLFMSERSSVDTNVVTSTGANTAYVRASSAFVGVTQPASSDFVISRDTDASMEGFAPAVSVSFDNGTTDVGKALNQLATDRKVFTFQPGGTAGGSVYTVWTELVAAALANKGPKTIFFDFSITLANIVISSSTNYDLGQDVTFAANPNFTELGMRVVFGPGASGGNVLARMPDCIDSVWLDNQAMTGSIVTQPAGIFHTKMVGNSRLTSSNSVAFLDATLSTPTFDMHDDARMLFISSGPAVSGPSVALNMYGGSVLGPNAVNASGTLAVNVYSSAVSIDTSQPGVSPTVTRITNAFLEGYAPLAAGDWPTTPNKVSQALDLLAAQVVAQKAHLLVFNPAAGAPVPGYLFTTWADLCAYSAALEAVAVAPIYVWCDLTAADIHVAGMNPAATQITWMADPALTRAGRKFIFDDTGGISTSVLDYTFVDIAMRSESTIQVFPNLGAGTIRLRGTASMEVNSRQFYQDSSSNTLTLEMFDQSRLNQTSIGGTTPVFEYNGIINARMDGNSFVDGFCLTATPLNVLYVSSGAEVSTQPTSPVVTLSEESYKTKFTPQFAGNWPVIPTQTADALNKLAARTRFLEKTKQVFVLRPGGIAGSNTFQTWTAVMDAISAQLPYPVEIVFDATNAPGDGNCHIDAGSWSIGAFCKFRGFPDQATQGFGVVVDDGATLDNWPLIVEDLYVESQSTGAVVSADPTVDHFYEIKGESTVVATGSAQMVTQAGTTGATLALSGRATLAIGSAEAFSAYELDILFDGRSKVDNNTVSATNACVFEINSDAAVYSLTQGGSPPSVILHTDAAVVGYTPGASGDWPVPPDDVAEALDDLANGMSSLFIQRTQFIYRPGGAATANVYTSWANLVTAAALNTGPKDIVIDCTGAPGDGSAHVPAGAWNLGTDARFVGIVNQLQNGFGLVFDAGATLTAGDIPSLYNVSVRIDATSPVIALTTGATDQLACEMRGFSFIEAVGAPFVSDVGTGSVLVGMYDASGLYNGGARCFELANVFVNSLDFSYGDADTFFGTVATFLATNSTGRVSEVQTGGATLQVSRLARMLDSIGSMITVNMADANQSVNAEQSITNSVFVCSGLMTTGRVFTFNTRHDQAQPPRLVYNACQNAGSARQQLTVGFATGGQVNIDPGFVGYVMSDGTNAVLAWQMPIELVNTATNTAGFVPAAFGDVPTAAVNVNDQTDGWQTWERAQAFYSDFAGSFSDFAVYCRAAPRPLRVVVDMQILVPDSSGETDARWDLGDPGIELVGKDTAGTLVEQANITFDELGYIKMGAITSLDRVSVHSIATTAGGFIADDGSGYKIRISGQPQVGIFDTTNLDTTNDIPLFNGLSGSSFQFDLGALAFFTATNLIAQCDTGTIQVRIVTPSVVGQQTLDASTGGVGFTVLCESAIYSDDQVGARAIVNRSFMIKNRDISSNQTVEPIDRVVHLDSSGGSYTVTLCATPNPGETVHYYGDCSANPVTIDGNGTTIAFPDGTSASTFDVEQAISFRIIYDGTNYVVFDFEPRTTGTTVERPIATFPGQTFFDLSLGYRIDWNGANWVNASGATV